MFFFDKLLRFIKNSTRFIFFFSCDVFNICKFYIVNHIDEDQMQNAMQVRFLRKTFPGISSNRSEFHRVMFCLSDVLPTRESCVPYIALIFPFL